MHPKGSGWRYPNISSGLREMTFVLPLKSFMQNITANTNIKYENIRFFQTTLEQSLVLNQNIVLSKKLLYLDLHTVIL